ncbi:hypothetical protein [Sphingobium phenoxybenzoativorans]|uniref:hypothetical protein n=1 Tax=Sphingobium phenoxybenzoativorans TaxID=1592790 RepID=UPI001112D470|nr:hypothetical protein [Sphingobium phenoxybenzoativorans]
MAIDFCTVSTNAWLLIDATAAITGCVVGYLAYVLIKRAVRDPLSLSVPNFLGGCLFPTIVAGIASYAVYLSVPADPCSGAFTDDGQFIPPIIFVIIGLSGVTSFWIAAWRKL